ncbi:hypothetical protein HG531_007712 [Fusarium graminearum]|nr:hypothetical protein HG531_007712 [Fusarium graminearum]
MRVNEALARVVIEPLPKLVFDHVVKSGGLCAIVRQCQSNLAEFEGGFSRIVSVVTCCVIKKMLDGDVFCSLIEGVAITQQFEHLADTPDEENIVRFHAAVSCFGPGIASLKHGMASCTDGYLGLSNTVLHHELLHRYVQLLLSLLVVLETRNLSMRCPQPRLVSHAFSEDSSKLRLAET